MNITAFVRRFTVKMQPEFKRYDKAYYDAVCDFFIALNANDKTNINWNWSRWERMYFDLSYDRSDISLNGLWFDGTKVVGAALYDHYPGEAFVGTLPSARYLLPEIIHYAAENLQDGDGLYISANDDDKEMKRLLLENRFHKTAEDESVFRIDLYKPLKFSELPQGIRIDEVKLPKDFYRYQLVLWKGFDNGNDMNEFEQSLAGAPEPKRPHAMQFLRLAAINENNDFVSFCQCWYHENTTNAYVGFVCTVPEYRGQGIASALVKEGLSRCYRMGAKEAFVRSEPNFFKSIGFEPFMHYKFYWTKR